MYIVSGSKWEGKQKWNSKVVYKEFGNEPRRNTKLNEFEQTNDKGENV